MIESTDWTPSASLEALRFRADRLREIRRFFDERQVLEVETPVLGHGGSVDPLLDSLSLEARGPKGLERLWLATSPEFHMKRLLAAGSGPIYQLARAFRDGERGRRHNLEFTLLEWYRPGYGLELLREECVELIERVIERPVQLRVHRYRQLFRDALDIDPFDVGGDELARLAAEFAAVDCAGWERDDCLDLLFSHAIEPALGADPGGPVALLDAVVDYPASQAALARKRFDPEDGAELAARFELYWQGVELANGYHELLDAGEQATRFLADNAARRLRGKPEVDIDRALLAALDHGLPACSGVALGVDRLLMLAAGEARIDAVIAFPFERC
ncbi:EF-P lysine aminoacylase EpmA [Halotalea alkalilenta]|uniref:EF-P lysine aminoacylase EpmA n=1 Tax=Halotalea alkalilenta TaxID=376489 RepID=UPI0005B8D6A4|nr:EF-P lysine aminoacylase EpmA [Halotalea alkalilenta]